MSAGRGWSGASHAGSNHPALACASAAPPYPRRGFLSCTLSRGIEPRLQSGAAKMCLSFNRSAS
jgi:hypothetical protein